MPRIGIRPSFEFLVVEEAERPLAQQVELIVCEAEKLRHQCIRDGIVTAEQRHAREIMNTAARSAADHELVIFAWRSQQVEEEASKRAIGVVCVGLDALASALFEKFAGEEFPHVVAHEFAVAIPELVTMR